MRNCLLFAAIGVVVSSLFVWDLFGTAEPPTAVAAEVDGAKLSYAKDVKPILQDRCFGCHNPEKKKAGVDLQAVSCIAHEEREAGQSE